MENENNENYDKNNIFAKIISGEIDCEKIYEDENILAFRDINPVSPIHILIIPKGEYISFDDFTTKASPEIIANFFKSAQKIAHDAGLQKDGYRLITNHGRDAMQSVEHFHMHILGGKQMGHLLAN